MQEYDAPFFTEEHYHVFNRAIGNDRLFRCDDNYDFFLQGMEEYILPVAEVYTYNLLPNHFHLFLKIKDDKEIQHRYFELHPVRKFSPLIAPAFVLQQFSNWCNSYAKSYNAMFNRKGRLFMESIRRKCVEDDEYFTQLIHYIHANAVQHGISDTLENWPHSAYHTLINNKPTWLKREEVLDWFGGLDQFIEFHQQPIYQKIKEDF